MLVVPELTILKKRASTARDNGTIHSKTAATTNENRNERQTLLGTAWSVIRRVGLTSGELVTRVIACRLATGLRLVKFERGHLGQLSHSNSHHLVTNCQSFNPYL